MLVNGVKLAFLPTLTMASRHQTSDISSKSLVFSHFAK